MGFPIWWYVAPTIINTFLESYDFSGKTVIPFATSGGSGLGETAMGFAPPAPLNLPPGKMLNGVLTNEVLQQWLNGLLL